MKPALMLVVQPAQGSGRHRSDGEISEAIKAETPEEYVIDHLAECDLCQRRLQALLDKMDRGSGG